jgi:hypothetical protein
MKFDIPKVTRFLPLQEYDPENKSLAGVGLQVWVDPPMSVLVEFDNLNRGYSRILNKLSAEPGKRPAQKISLGEYLLGWIKILGIKKPDSGFQAVTESYRRSLYTWYARQWSQAPDAETHWSADELEKIDDENPRRYEWLCISSWSLVEKHREDVKKGWRGPSASLPEPEGPATPSSEHTSSPSTSTPPPAGP